VTGRSYSRKSLASTSASSRESNTSPLSSSSRDLPFMSEQTRSLFYAGEPGGGLWACRVAGRSGWIGGMGCRRGPDHKAGGASMARAIA
jgi:hypothetical protein